MIFSKMKSLLLAGMKKCKRFIWGCFTIKSRWYNISKSVSPRHIRNIEVKGIGIVTKVLFNVYKIMNMATLTYQIGVVFLLKLNGYVKMVLKQLFLTMKEN